jgi:hypothetical protein
MLVGYRLQRARETVEEARVLLETDHANACVNRLYYACFYAVSALLLTPATFSYFIQAFYIDIRQIDRISWGQLAFRHASLLT